MSMYMNAEDVVSDISKIEVTVPKVVRLAKVTSVNNKQPGITFYGDALESRKTYKMIDGYNPAVNDIVACMAQGDTWIIIGKLVDQASAKAAYLTKTEADGYYATVTHSHSEYALTTHNHDSTYSKTTHNHDSTYSKTSHTHNIYSDDRGNTILTATYSDSKIKPATDKKYYLGTDSYRFKNVHSETVNTDILRTSKDSGYYSSSMTIKIYANLNPAETNTWSLGTSSYKYNNVYTTNINGSTATSSDRNLKEEIADLDERHIDLIKRIRPVSFRYRDGGRTHYGFIAQELEDVANELGFGTDDFAPVCIDRETGEYSIRYYELIAMQNKVIQDLCKRVSELERGLNGADC